MNTKAQQNTTGTTTHERHLRKPSRNCTYLLVLTLHVDISLVSKGLRGRKLGPLDEVRDSLAGRLDGAKEGRDLGQLGVEHGNLRHETLEGDAGGVADLIKDGSLRLGLHVQGRRSTNAKGWGSRGKGRRRSKERHKDASSDLHDDCVDGQEDIQEDIQEDGWTRNVVSVNVFLLLCTTRGKRQMNGNPSCNLCQECNWSGFALTTTRDKITRR